MAHSVVGSLYGASEVGSLIVALVNGKMVGLFVGSLKFVMVESPVVLVGEPVGASAGWALGEALGEALGWQD